MLYCGRAWNALSEYTDKNAEWSRKYSVVCCCRDFYATLPATTVNNAFTPLYTAIAYSKRHTSPSY